MISSSSSTCLFIEENNLKETEPIKKTNDTCILQSSETIRFDSISFNRSYLTEHCNEQCNQSTSIALISFLEDEIPPYLDCNDGPIRACNDPYITFNTHSSALMLYQPLYHPLPFDPFWTLSNRLGSFEDCAYGTNVAPYLFEQTEKNCSLELFWLCKCSSSHN